MMDWKYFPMLYKDYSRYHQVSEDKKLIMRITDVTNVCCSSCLF